MIGSGPGALLATRIDDGLARKVSTKSIDAILDEELDGVPPA